ncbi:hypothetical protein PINS_up020890 [Pythium insidiosum]|nr:hypothetical protein PINS_up013688 [Pythium insidiosum]GLE09281.1 hypothetical protein PINS_up020890 [Pythium insidiosum]
MLLAAIARLTVCVVALYPPSTADAAHCQVHCPPAALTEPAVCGSDGVTYGSLCLLTAKSCSTPSLHMLHTGKCASSKAPTTTTAVPATASPAPPIEAVEAPEANGSCKKRCTDAVQLLCGSDNVTYRNACQFSNALCSNAALRIAYIGQCTLTLPPVPPFCDDDARCTPKQLEYRPTCASDGQTYATVCAFKRAFCADPTQRLAVVHDGVCTSSS